MTSPLASPFDATRFPSFLYDSVPAYRPAPNRPFGYERTLPVSFFRLAERERQRAELANHRPAFWKKSKLKEGLRKAGKGKKGEEARGRKELGKGARGVRTYLRVLDTPLPPAASGDSQDEEASLGSRKTKFKKNENWCKSYIHGNNQYRPRWMNRAIEEKEASMARFPKQNGD